MLHDMRLRLSWFIRDFANWNMKFKSMLVSITHSLYCSLWISSSRYLAFCFSSLILRASRLAPKSRGRPQNSLHSILKHNRYPTGSHTLFFFDLNVVNLVSLFPMFGIYIVNKIVSKWHKIWSPGLAPLRLSLKRFW